MKKLMVAFMALSFLTATVGVSFAQDQTTTKQEKKSKKKKSSKKKTDETK